MTTRGRATFKIEQWDEKPYLQPEGGGKLTRARVIRSFDGDIDGQGTIEYLMAYRADGSASFVGLEHVVGRLGGRPGTFVLRHQGTSESGMVTTTWSVVPGSGTGELQGLEGEGGFASGHQDRYLMTLDYSIT